MSVPVTLMEFEHVLSPSSAESYDQELLGGKGTGLFRLYAYGLPIPRTLVLTSKAYTDFCRERELSVPALRESLRRPPSPKQIKDWRYAFLTRSLVDDSQVLARLREELSAAFTQIGFSPEPFDPGVAVRSSATIEDSTEKSYAGMFLSTLSVRSINGVLNAVLRCWASLWTPRVMENVSPRDAPKMAIVVQETIPAVAAGVAFSSLPRDSSTVLINASWGLAKGVADGSVSPDDIRVDVESSSVKYRIGRKQILFSTKPGNGVEEKPTPPEMRQRLSLKATEAVELARLCKKAEQAFGRPLDIEWTLADGEFKIVQARPLVSSRFA